MTDTYYGRVRLMCAQISTAISNTERWLIMSYWQS